MRILFLVFSLLIVRTYHKVPIQIFAQSGSKWTHVQMTAVVEDVFQEKDGDTHIVLVQKLHDKKFAVAECIPELPCQKPKKGSTITVKGISRRDETHGWNEIHPVESLKPVLQKTR